MSICVLNLALFPPTAYCFRWPSLMALWLLGKTAGEDFLTGPNVGKDNGRRFP